MTNEDKIQIKKSLEVLRYNGASGKSYSTETAQNLVFILNKILEELDHAKN